MTDYNRNGKKKHKKSNYRFLTIEFSASYNIFMVRLSVETNLLGYEHISAIVLQCTLSLYASHFTYIHTFDDIQ